MSPQSNEEVVNFSHYALLGIWEDDYVPGGTDYCVNLFLIILATLATKTHTQTLPLSV